MKTDPQISDADIKIFIFLKDNPKSRLIANATVCIDTLAFGNITIKYFQIWKSTLMNEKLQEAINIKPYAIKVFNAKYLPVLFFNDPKAWERIELRIYDAYCLAKSNKNRSISISEDIDPDDVPL